jgi:hypothetical protein
LNTKIPPFTEIYLYDGSKFVALSPHVKGYVPGSTEDIAAYVGGRLPNTWIDSSQDRGGAESALPV